MEKEGIMKVRLIPVILLVLLVGMDEIVSAQNPIGLLMEGYESDCKVKRGKTEINCRYLMELFQSDEIIKLPDAKKVKVQWLYPPYTKAEQLNKTTLRISYNPPSNKGVLGASKEVLGLLKDALPFIKESAKVSKPVATRGLSSPYIDLWIIPQPGYSSTVLRGYAVTFYWGIESATSILFNDSKGNVVFQKGVKGKSSIELTPEEIGLRVNEVYTWEIEGVKLDGPYTIKLLGEEIARQTKHGLKEIESMGISNEEKSIYKALYLQTVSDLFPQEVDLYWLSYIMIKPLNNDISKELKRRCLLHLNSDYGKR
jgi:hypothetical protein